MIGRKIRLLRPVGRYKAGSEGVITGDCGCRSNPRWIVRMGNDESSEIQVSQRNTKGYERWEYVQENKDKP